MSNYRIITAVPTTDRSKLPSVYLGELVFTVQTRQNYGHYREININHNRYDLQQKFNNLSGVVDLVLLMDSDVKVSKDTLSKLLEAFDGSTPICVNTKGDRWDTERHICCACCLMRYEDWQKIDYIGTYVDDCQCKKIMELFPDVHYVDGLTGTEDPHGSYQPDPNNTDPFA
jgi:hypothetical protein